MFRRLRPLFATTASLLFFLRPGFPAAASGQEVQFHLDTLHVAVASRADGGAPARAVEILTADDLRALPIRTVSEALLWMLGADLDVRSPAQADVSIRGASFEQVVVLVDGVRMSDPQSGHFDLDLAVPLETVRRVEVLRGPGSFLYGADAVGGVINIVTDSGGGTDVVAAGESGSFQTRRAGVSLRSRAGGFRFGAAGDWMKSDGHRPGTDHEIAQGALNLEAPLGRVRMRARAAIGSRDFGADGFYAPFPSWEETTTRTGSVELTLPLSGLALRARLWRRSHDDDFVLKREDPSFYRNVHTSSQTGVEWVARARLTPGLALAGGVEWARESLESTRLGTRREDRQAAFVEVRHDIDRVELQAGLRADHYDRFGTFLAPSLAASWQVAHGLRLRGAVGRGFRAPSWTERYYQDPANKGTEDLGPERAWTVESGIDARAGGGTVRLTAFIRRATDLIDWVRSDASNVWEARNVDEADFRGVEIEGRGFRLGPLRLRGALSLLRLESHDAPGLESKYALRPLNRRALLSVSIPLPGRAALTLHALHARREGAGAYERMDARLRLPAGPGTLSLDVRNLLDARYLDIAGMPAAGRGFSLGYRVAWRPS